jgi:hypothetical protein
MPYWEKASAGPGEMMIRAIYIYIYIYIYI